MFWAVGPVYLSWNATWVGTAKKLTSQCRKSNCVQMKRPRRCVIPSAGAEPLIGSVCCHTCDVAEVTTGRTALYWWDWTVWTTGLVFATTNSLIDCCAMAMTALRNSRHDQSKKLSSVLVLEESLNEIPHFQFLLETAHIPAVPVFLSPKQSCPNRAERLLRVQKSNFIILPIKSNPIVFCLFVGKWLEGILLVVRDNWLSAAATSAHLPAGHRDPLALAHLKIKGKLRVQVWQKAKVLRGEIPYFPLIFSREAFCITYQLLQQEWIGVTVKGTCAVKTGA